MDRLSIIKCHHTKIARNISRDLNSPPMPDPAIVLHITS